MLKASPLSRGNNPTVCSRKEVLRKTWRFWSRQTLPTFVTLRSNIPRYLKTKVAGIFTFAFSVNIGGDGIGQSRMRTFAVKALTPRVRLCLGRTTIRLKQKHVAVHAFVSAKRNLMSRLATSSFQRRSVLSGRRDRSCNPGRLLARNDASTYRAFFVILNSVRQSN